MQTFAPYSDFEASARALDPKRLGKQRVEVIQIVRALTVPGYAWTSHPAVLMWKGYEEALGRYGLTMCDVWVELGFGDTCATTIVEDLAAVGIASIRSYPELAADGALPPWLFDPQLLRSHQSSLVRKDPEHYRPLFPDVPDDLDYFWPVRSPVVVERELRKIENARRREERAAEKRAREAAKARRRRSLAARRGWETRAANLAEKQRDQVTAVRRRVGATMDEKATGEATMHETTTGGARVPGTGQGDAAVDGAAVHGTGTDGTGAFGAAVAAVRSGADPRTEAKQLFDRLSEDERLGLLDGDTPFWPGLAEMMVRYNATPLVHGEVARLGVPGTRFVDGPRGCVAGAGTAFPVSMARGATWDVRLEERVGEAIGREVRASGGNFFGGVCINLPRHPAWGRIQETYGDDPHHLGEFGAALTRGVQRYAMACAKHYALNSMENARFRVDVTVDEATLHEVYLPHFKRTVDEGVAAIMSAYNSVNGEWAGQNPYLLTEVLRDQWGWDGITVSDFIWGLRDAAASLNAGLDLEEPFRQQRAQHLPGQVESGGTSWAAVERAGVRLLAAQLRSYAGRDAEDPGPEVMASQDHRGLAREVAGRAMVLLKNDVVGGAPVLPLDPGTTRRIAVIGRLAVAPNTGDLGSSLVHPPSHVTPYEGIVAAFGDAEVVLVDADDPAAAAEAAGRADVAIVVAGFTEVDEGEYVAVTP